MMKKSENDRMTRHQAVLFELLSALDAVCKQHGIHYMLFAGTALGAVRHQGFIPWDDDLDVVMLRPDYERFLRVAPQELDPKKYYLQAEYSEHWPMFFSKLRKNGTTCFERYQPRDPQMHQGIYIDIFPCDNLSGFPILRGLQFLASKAVIAKSLDRRGYLTDNAAKKLLIRLCRFLPQKPLLRLVEMRSSKPSKWVHTFLGGASRYRKNIYPRAWFEEGEFLPFETGAFPVSAQWDAMLTQLYGDYRTPLPQAQRGQKVHAEFVDPEHSYTQYLEQQKQMIFRQFTRSIR